MEAYDYSNSYSSSSSKSTIQSLHSVRKSSSQAKPWKKAPVAPPPPQPVKVYKVDPINFRDLVQQLTGAPELKAQPQSTMLSSGRDIESAAAASTVPTNWFMGAHLNQ